MELPVKKRVLVVDDAAVFREPIAFALQARGYNVLSAEAGLEALRIVESSVQAFDLMIVDYSMPDLTGLEFLERASAWPRMKDVPVIMLTDMAERDVVRRAHQLKVSDYILKSSFSLGTLLGKVDKAVTEPKRTSHEPTPTLIREEGHAMQPAQGRSPLSEIRGFVKGKPIPESVRRILSLVGSDSLEATDIVKAISSDPFLVARVLKLANSSLYLRQDRKVTDVGDAVSMLGLNAITEIASAGILCRDTTGRSSDCHDASLAHVVATAQVMERLVGDNASGATAHIVGICHDLPDQVVAEVFPREHDAAVSSCDGNVSKFKEALSETLGVSYMEIVCTVLDAFGLPATIMEPIVGLHERRRRHTSSNQLVTALRIAHSTANALGYSSFSDKSLDLFSSDETATIIGNDSTDPELITGLGEEIGARLGFLGVPSPTQSAKVSSFASGQYLRDSSHSPLDPLRLWLSLRTEHLVTARLGEAVEPVPGGFVVIALSGATAASDLGRACERLALLENAGANAICVVSPSEPLPEVPANIPQIKAPLPLGALEMFLLRK